MSRVARPHGRLRTDHDCRTDCALPGITLKNADVIVSNSDVLIQHIAIRPRSYLSDIPCSPVNMQPSGWSLPPASNRDCITVAAPSAGTAVVSNWQVVADSGNNVFRRRPQVSRSIYIKLADRNGRDRGR